MHESSRRLQEVRDISAQITSETDVEKYVQSFRTVRERRDLALGVCEQLLAKKEGERPYMPALTTLVSFVKRNEFAFVLNRQTMQPFGVVNVHLWKNIMNMQLRFWVDLYQIVDTKRKKIIPSLVEMLHPEYLSSINKIITSDGSKRDEIPSDWDELGDGYSGSVHYAHQFFKLVADLRSLVRFSAIGLF